MDQYIFEKNQDDRELARLRLIEHALDEASIARLQSTGIRQGWRCLEVGAGAGSITQWMGEVVGPQGEVAAIDIKTNYLEHFSSPPYRIVQGDFCNVPLDGEFDLAHCRYVLIHNRQSPSLLKKLCSLAKPGGFLVLEEPDFTSAKLLNQAGDASQQRVNNAICRMFEQMDLDPAYGLSLPAKVAAEGLKILRVDAHVHLNRGGDAMARMMGESTLALREKYLATGEAGPADIDAYIRNANDPSFWSVYYSTVSVVAVQIGEQLSDCTKETGLIGGVEKTTIEIVDYQPFWQEKFQIHANVLAKALGETALRIEHIGSTSVPGLAAKPIVDILVVVADSADEGSYLPRMERAGYELRVREPDFYEHRMFRTRARDVHVHFYSPDSPEIERYLTFRDRLRKNAEDRQCYQQTKRKLATQSWPDMNAYAEAKTEVIERILASVKS